MTENYNFKNSIITFVDSGKNNGSCIAVTSKATIRNNVLEFENNSNGMFLVVKNKVTRSNIRISEDTVIEIQTERKLYKLSFVHGILKVE